MGDKINNNSCSLSTLNSKIDLLLKKLMNNVFNHKKKLMEQEFQELGILFFHINFLINLTASRDTHQVIYCI